MIGMRSEQRPMCWRARCAGQHREYPFHGLLHLGLLVTAGTISMLHPPEWRFHGANLSFCAVQYAGRALANELGWRQHDWQPQFWCQKLWEQRISILVQSFSVRNFSIGWSETCSTFPGRKRWRAMWQKDCRGWNNFSSEIRQGIERNNCRKNCFSSKSNEVFGNELPALQVSAAYYRLAFWAYALISLWCSCPSGLPTVRQLSCNFLRQRIKSPKDFVSAWHLNLIRIDFLHTFFQGD